MLRLPLLALLVAAAPAWAQLRVPALPTLPAARLPDSQPPRLPLAELRPDLLRGLLRDHPARFEADPAGEPVLRGELLLASPAAATVAAALAQGFVLRREEALDGLNLRSVVLQPPPGVSLAAALARLRTLDPALVADFHHLYTRSGEAGAVAPSSGAAGSRVGLIDAGVDATHAALRHATIRRAGCAGFTLPSAHGTAVASLLLGDAPAATLYAADVYCDRVDGGSAEAVAKALAWLARERVGVVNVSLVGPRNALLEAAVRAFVERGHVVVAAVGNDGPAAPPLYPAAYAGVVGVTGVWASRRVLPEAAQGPHVMFAAPGAALAGARGTSFAAPLVAALLAPALRLPDPAAAQRALQALAAQALDLGVPGRDPVYGLGLVAEHARVARR